jgi:hypothetical protein
MRALAGFILGSLVVTLGGCKIGNARELSAGQASAHVNCKVASDAVNCDVTETQGTAEIDVCWDFTATCNNGAKLTAPRSCTKVKGGGTTRHSVPLSKLNIRGTCDRNPKGEMSNMTLNGKST